MAQQDADERVAKFHGAQACSQTASQCPEPVEREKTKTYFKYERGGIFSGNSTAYVWASGSVLVDGRQAAGVEHGLRMGYQ